ncbi:MAG TPA: alpha/beta fold hydrolase [Chitinophaga sp.]|uniref:alpha/beta fold hydrolase n=1 Tax=Chitinophaga sp. TaxID=1869181 RepID=UPI002F955063
MPAILMLHGALGTQAQFLPLRSLLEEQHTIHTFDFIGHGLAEPAPEGVSVPLLAQQVLEQLDALKLNSVTLFGYSMGGYVAMYLARHYPQRVGKVITLATKYHWNAAIAAKEVNMLDAAVIEQKVPAFATALEQRHARQGWKKVLSHTAALMQQLGAQPLLAAEDYATITIPALLMLGDRDTMVTLTETVEVYRALPQAQLAVLPGTPHPLEKADPALVAALLQRFLNE